MSVVLLLPLIPLLANVRASTPQPVATSCHTWAVPTLQPGEYLVTVQLSS